MTRLLPLLLLAGCAGGTPGSTCHQALRAELLFGLSSPRGTIDAPSFAAFLDRSVTPRFPAGLTMLEGAGRWQAPDGRLTQEPSRLVLIVTTPGPGSVARLNAIRDDYKTAFQQQSVGLLLSPTCADF